MTETKLARELTAEDKDEFLRLICEGMSPDVAARELGSTGTQFRRLRNPLGEHYDPAFAEAFKAAITSDAHEQGRLERIRDLIWKRAEAGDVKILEKLALIYDPDWQPLRHQNLNVNMNVLARALPFISTAELERAVAELEKTEEDGTIEGGRVIQIAERSGE